MLEQISIFDLLNMENSGSSLGKITDGNNDENDLQDYLKRGEKILSLLRKRREFVPSELFESFRLKIYQSKNSSNEKLIYLETCAEKFLKHKWCEACKNDNFTSFFQVIGIDATVTKLPEEDLGSKMLKNKLRNKNYSGGVKITVGGKDIYAPIGDVSLGRCSGKVWYWRSYPNQKFYLREPYKHFKRTYLLRALKERVAHELKDLPDEKLADNRVAHFLKISIEEAIRKYTDEQENLKIHNEILKVPYIMEFLSAYNYSCYVDNFGMREHDFLPLWFLADMQCSIESFGASLYSGFVTKLFNLLYDVYTEDKQTDKFMREVASEYAKVYQTKKSISNKVVKAMSQSGFNEYFGYVEFDDECDLTKMEEIYKEFKALQNHVFHQGKKADVSIRFRKLGKHRANGLYFPVMKCICVDVRSPSSLAHEYGHMVDHEYGDVSRGVKFTPIRERYRKLLEDYVRNLPIDSPQKLQLMGNTKYNLSYYLEATEIFARALEIYLVRCRQIDNSLVKPDGGFAYPDDKQLTEAIKTYFNEFFGYGEIAANKVTAAL